MWAARVFHTQKRRGEESSESQSAKKMESEKLVETSPINFLTLKMDDGTSSRGKDERGAY